MNILTDIKAEELGKDSVYAETIRKIQAEVDSFMPDWKDDPSYMSRWGHSYFCNEDGGRLIFDIRKPHEHVCSVCGKVYTGFPWDGVWVYFLRNSAILTALKSALVFRVTKDEKYLGITKEIIGFYAENYSNFRLHNKENIESDSIKDMKWGSGRMMPQSLNESIVMIRTIEALLLVNSSLDDEFKTMVKEKFMRPMVEVMTPQIDKIHNIRVWLMAAVGSMALYLDDKKLYDWAISSEFGITNQLSKGVTGDGFWYEGSIHYNFFLLEGVANLMMLSSLYKADFKEENYRTVEKMLIKAYDYAFSTNNFPNPNDGWPDLNLKTFGYIYQIAAFVYGEDSPTGNILKNFMDSDAERTTLPLSESYYCRNCTCLEELMLNSHFNWKDYKKIERKSYNYQKSNYAMLRRESLETFIKYGLNGPSHAHPDVMNMEIEFADQIVSRDISNAGYNSALCKKWHRRSLAHNTIVVDGENQQGTEPGETVCFDDHRIVVKNQHLYPGLDVERELALTDCFTLDDRMSVKGETGHSYDYVFHFEKEFAVTSDVEMAPASIGYSDNGYEYSEDVMKAGSCDRVVFTAVKDGMSVRMSVFAKDAQVFLLKTMDNPVNSKRTTIIVRREGTEAQFHSHFEFADLRNKEQRFFKNAEIKASSPDEGITRKVLAHNKNLMVCELHFKKGAVGALHKHFHEQCSYIISGKFEMNVGGKKVVVGPGDSTYKVPGIVHGGICLEEGSLLDIFTPEREDFLNLKD